MDEDGADSAAFDVIVAGAGMTGGDAGARPDAKSGLAVALIDAQPVSAQLAPTLRRPRQRHRRRLHEPVAGAGRGPAALEEAAEPIRSILVTDGAAPGASARRSGGGFLRFDGADLGDDDPDAPLGWMVENRHIRAMPWRRRWKPRGCRSSPRRRWKRCRPTRAPPRVSLEEDGRTLTVAPLVVGAEGRKSVVREAAGIKTYGWTYAQTGVVATVRWPSRTAASPTNTSCQADPWPSCR